MQSDTRKNGIDFFVLAKRSVICDLSKKNYKFLRVFVCGGPRGLGVLSPSHSDPKKNKISQKKICNFYGRKMVRPSL